MLKPRLHTLKKQLIEYAALVEGMIHDSIYGLCENKSDSLEKILSVHEPKANETEIIIDQHCANIIGQYEPRAKDLRMVLMILKMNNDLERMGDHAVNIAQSALSLIEKPQIKPLIDIPKMSELAEHMLHDSISAFITEDANLAAEICTRDKLVNNLRDQIYRELITYMTADPSTIERALHLMRISRNLERIADLSTNISEDIVYMISGLTIKHHHSDISSGKTE